MSRCTECGGQIENGEKYFECGGCHLTFCESCLSDECLKCGFSLKDVKMEVFKKKEQKEESIPKPNEENFGDDLPNNTGANNQGQESQLFSKPGEKPMDLNDIQMNDKGMDKKMPATENFNKKKNNELSMSQKPSDERRGEYNTYQKDNMVNDEFNLLHRSSHGEEEQYQRFQANYGEIKDEFGYQQPFIGQSIKLNQGQGMHNSMQDNQGNFAQSQVIPLQQNYEYKKNEVEKSNYPTRCKKHPFKGEGFDEGIKEKYVFFFCNTCNQRFNCTECMKTHSQNCGGIKINKKGLALFKEEITELKKKLKLVQMNFNENGERLSQGNTSYLDSIYLKLKKSLNKKKTNLTGEIKKKIEEKKGKIGELIDTLKEASSGQTRDVLKNMTESLDFVNKNKENLESLTKKKLVYKANFEEKIGLNEIIPKTYRTTFFIQFNESNQPILKEKFVLYNNVEYEITVSYLKDYQKYSVFITRMNKEQGNPQNKPVEQPNQRKDKTGAEDIDEMVFTLTLKRGNNFKNSITDKCKRNADKFGVKYFVVRNKIDLNYVYSLKLKLRFDNYFAKCFSDGKKFDEILNRHDQKEKVNKKN